MNDPGTTRRDFLSGRSGVGDTANPSTEPAVDSAGSESRILTKLSKPAMACWFEFLIDARRFPMGPELAQNALELVEEIERELSVYLPSSHLSEVNRLAADEPVQVSARLLELLTTSLDLHASTNGAFDVTAGPLSKAWGFYQRKPNVPSREAIDQALTRVGSKFIELDREQSIVRFRNPGLEINLASIGKGFALDCSGAYLRSNGVSEFVLHGGQSSVLTGGCQDDAHPEQGWTIGLVHPVNPQARIGCVRLRDRALGTSGCQRQWLVHEGRRLGHVLDPRTGWPATDSLSVTVLAPSAALADALSTAFSVMGLDEVKRYCRDHPDISAIVATENANDPTRPNLHLFNLRDDDWQPIAATAGPGESTQIA